MISISTIYVLISVIIASLGFAFAASSEEHLPLSEKSTTKDTFINFLICFLALVLWPITISILAFFLAYKVYVGRVKKKYIAIFLEITNENGCFIFHTHDCPNFLDKHSHYVIDKINDLKHLKYILYASKFDVVQLTDNTRAYIQKRIIDLSFEKTILEGK